MSVYHMILPNTLNVTCINVDMDDIKNTLILSIFLHIMTMVIIIITTSMTCYMYFQPLCSKNRIHDINTV